MTSSSDSSSLYASTVQSGHPVLMQFFRPILAFKPLIAPPPTSYPLSLHTHDRLLLLAVSLQLLLSDRHACVVYQNDKSRSFQVRQGVPQGSVLSPILLSLFIDDLPTSLPSSVSCSLCADDLAIWFSFPLSLLRWRPHKELCFDWSADLNTGVFLSIRANVRPPSSQWIPTKLTSSPTSFYSTPASVSILLQLFLGSP